MSASASVGRARFVDKPRSFPEWFTMSLAIRPAAVLALLVLLAASAAPAAEEAGQADLDKAIAEKITAESLDDLSKVIELCQSALDRGLGKENTDFAKKLLSATLLQRATLVSERLQSLPNDATAIQQFVRLRQIALADLERALRHDDSLQEAHYLIGRLHTLPGGDRQRAMTALDEAIKLQGEDDSTRSKALALRATLHQDPEKRLADYNEAIKLDPRSAEALRARAMFQLERGKSDEGLADLKAAIKLDPEHAATYELEGVALASLEKYDEALASLNKAIELEPKSPFSFVHRARIYLIQNKPKEAIADLDQALALQLPTPTVLLLRAGAYQQLGEKEKALADVDEALKLRPNHLPSLRARALLLAGDGKFESAITDLEEVKKALPRDPGVLLQLAALQAAGKHLQEAVETYGSVLEIDVKNQLARQGRADTLLRLGKQADAIADYEAVLKEEPKNSHVLNNLAWLLATSPDDKLRDGKRAIELATEGCKVTDYKQAHLLSTLAAGYAETGDYKTAIEWSQKAVAVAPDEEMKANLVKELESYQASKPWRELLTEPAMPEADAPAEKTANKPGDRK
jgi:tetratricopeptide (TPR) repeat protein